MVTFCCIQVAKDSLSHRSFHQDMVTVSPVHWWASSWAITLKDERL